MRLYYMTSLDVGLIILRERRLKLSEFKDLNDPFELLAVSLEDKLVRKMAKALREHWSSTIGVICFSDNWKSPVMWAHYGAKHYGVCLGFDVPDDAGLIGKVDYSPTRLAIELDKLNPTEAVTLDFLKALLHTKALEWEYEREYRVMADLSHREGPNNFAFVDFGPNLLLREVILGCRCTASIGAIAKATGRHTKSVQVLRARPAFREFAMVRNRTVTPINVQPSRGSPQSNSEKSHRASTRLRRPT